MSRKTGALGWCLATDGSRCWLMASANSCISAAHIGRYLNAARLPAAVRGSANDDGGKLLYGKNDCESKIRVHLLWHQTDDTWHKVEWLIPGGAEGYLTIDGERVRADIVSHWAESVDGKCAWRSELKDKEIDISGGEGDRYELHYRTP